MAEITEFTGCMKITPKYAKCESLIVHGHWELKETGKPYKVWCNDGLYKNGVNEEICEIYRKENNNAKVRELLSL